MYVNTGSFCQAHCKAALSLKSELPDNDYIFVPSGQTDISERLTQVHVNPANELDCQTEMFNLLQYHIATC